MKKNASNEMLFPKRTGKRKPCICFREGILHKEKPSGERREKGSAIFFAAPIAGQQTKKKHHRNDE